MITVAQLKPEMWIRREGSPVQVTSVTPLGDDCFHISLAGLKPWERWSGMYEGHWYVQCCSLEPAALAGAK